MPDPPEAFNLDVAGRVEAQRYAVRIVVAGPLELSGDGNTMRRRVTARTLR